MENKKKEDQASPVTPLPDPLIMVVPDATAKTLQNLAQQIQVLQGYIRVIGETLINANNLKGECQFNQDYTKIICKQ